VVDLVFRSDEASRHRHGVEGSASGAGFGAAASRVEVSGFGDAAAALGFDVFPGAQECRTDS